MTTKYIPTPSGNGTEGIAQHTFYKLGSIHNQWSFRPNQSQSSFKTDSKTGGKLRMVAKTRGLHLEHLLNILEHDLRLPYHSQRH